MLGRPFIAEEPVLAIMLIAFFLLIAFLLLSGGPVGKFFGFFVGLGWSAFHLFIGLLQAFIFMILTVVYLSIAHQPVEH